MNLFRSRSTTACVVVLLGCLTLRPAAAHAQLFGELVGGWNYVPTFSSGPTYASGSAVRVSVGWKVAQNFSWRIDAFANQFEAKDDFAYPCPSFGCSPSVHLHSASITGLTANGLVSVDPRGIFYLIGGAGFYVVDITNIASSEQHFGVSAGAGIAVPMGSRLRGVVEARWHSLHVDTTGPTWFAPITVGLRY